MSGLQRQLSDVVPVYVRCSVDFCRRLYAVINREKFISSEPGLGGDGQGTAAGCCIGSGEFDQSPVISTTWCRVYPRLVLRRRAAGGVWARTPSHTHPATHTQPHTLTHLGVSPVSVHRRPFWARANRAINSSLIVTTPRRLPWKSVARSRRHSVGST